MLTYNMDSRGELGKYEYLYWCIRRDIERGTIEADERLPSKRSLASHLGVSVVTVEQAYAQLVAEGYLHANVRSGFYANALPSPPFSSSAAKPSYAENGSSAHTPRAKHSTQAIADFSASPPFDDRSFGAWMRALRKVAASEDPSEAFSGIPAKGSPRLRAAIARHLHGSRGIVASPDDIVIGAGAQALYGLIVQLLGRDVSYAVEDPGYPNLASIYRAHGACVVHSPIDMHGIDVDALERNGTDIVHVMPSHQFPTGIVTNAVRRYELLKWAMRSNERYIVEDDYDCELRLTGRPVPALASVDSEERVIYLNTFSRSISSTLRVAYMVLPPSLSQRFDRELGFYASTVSALGQVALAGLIEDGSYERGINRMRTAHRAQRNRLQTAVEEAAPKGGLWLEQADSGLHCILCARTNRDEEAIAAECRKKGVLLTPLAAYCSRKENYRAYLDSLHTPQAARFPLSYAGMDADTLRKALRIVAESCS